MLKDVVWEENCFLQGSSLLELSSTVLVNGNVCTQFYRQIRPDAYPLHNKKTKFLSSTTFYLTNFGEKSSNTWPEIHSGFWFLDFSFTERKRINATALI